MDFKEIDSILMKHSVVRYNFRILNPINREEEFARFLKDTTYNPQFIYHEYDAIQAIKELEQLVISNDTPLGKVFDDVRNSLLIEAKALAHIGTSTYNTVGLFSPVPQNVLEKAQEILEVPLEDDDDEGEEETISSQELGQIMLEQLAKYDCHEWKVAFNEHAAARASVSAAQKKVTIKSNEYFSPTAVKKLLVHEISTHVLRAKNGEAQEYGIFTIGIPGYLATEEGLAGYNERSQGIEKESTLRYYALSTLITHLCSQQSFVKVYHQVRKYFNEDWDCFRAVARPKRGLGDTSQPGGYLKDHCYLEGLMLIEEFVDQGGDIKELYAAKIGISHLSLVRDGILKPANILPEFLE